MQILQLYLPLQAANSHWSAARLLIEGPIKTLDLPARQDEIKTDNLCCGSIDFSGRCDLNFEFDFCVNKRLNSTRLYPSQYKE
jgi:hypothetical protein